MDYKTFDHWSAMGYKIVKGSKATWINDVAMFSKDQVVRLPARQVLPKGMWYNEDYDYDDPMTFDNWMGKH